MKILLLSILTALSVYAGEMAHFIMSPLSKIMLTNIDSDSASFTVYLPGKASGICSLIMFSDSNHPDFHNLDSLIKKFKISTATTSRDPIVTTAFTRFPLLNENISQLHINILKIETIDGKNISENIRELYKYSAPVWLATDFCKSSKQLNIR